MKQGIFTITENIPLTSNVFKMRLEGDTSHVTASGQFVNVKLDGLFLRRPISVYDCDENAVTIIYKVVGRGTEQMSKMAVGEKLDVLTGLGNGYDLDKSGDNPVLIGGGVGVPPMYLLAKKLANQGKKLTVILGFNTKDEVFCEQDFRDLGADVYVKGMMASFPETAAKFLPAVIFLVACVLAFATGTSWGTFGILIPIVTSMFGIDDPLLFVGISACLAGAVCGDHCSPISDTTIMASAGANCNHVDHVSTQLPYAVTVAGISFVCYILAGFVPNAWICLPVGAILTVATLFGIRFYQKKKTVVAE